MRDSLKAPVVIDTLPGRWVTLFRVLATLTRGRRAVPVLPHSVVNVPAVSIGDEWLKRYCEVCGFDSGRSTAPVLLPQLLGFPLVLHYFASAHFPWSALGVVHLGDEIEASRALEVGEALSLSLRTGELISHPKGQAFSLTVALAQDGREVWRATQTLLRLGVNEPVGPRWDEAAALGQCSNGNEAAALGQRGNEDEAVSLWPSVLAFDRVGSFDAPADIGRRYAPVSGDFNPIHLSRWSARWLGFDRSIAHGMWSLARALAVLGVDRIDGPHRLQTVFGSPVRLPARVTVWAARVDSALTFEVRDQEGERVHLRGRLVDQWSPS